MSEITQVLAAIEAGDARAASQLLPLVYDELRQLAAARLADEKPGHTLQPTALVHEAYLRLVGDGQPQDWNGRKPVPFRYEYLPLAGGPSWDANAEGAGWVPFPRDLNHSGGPF